jgi:radical SAM superfamily enzyme with C-terminal helix-hairpin-helix motif
MFPTGQVLKRVYWESHDNRIRLPSNLSEEHRNSAIHGKAGVTFGRQIGAYPILIGASYQIPLESESDIVVTSHGKKSITGVELGLDINTVSQSQLQAIPGIGEKTAWRIVSNRAKILRKNRDSLAFDSLEDAFEGEVPELAFAIFNA